MYFYRLLEDILKQNRVCNEVLSSWTDVMIIDDKEMFVVTSCTSGANFIELLSR